MKLEQNGNGTLCCAALDEESFDSARTRRTSELKPFLHFRSNDNKESRRSTLGNSISQLALHSTPFLTSSKRIRRQLYVWLPTRENR